MPEPIPEDWIDAALAADAAWMRSARAVVYISPARDQVRAMLEAVAPLIAAAERERAGVKLAEISAYVTDARAAEAKLTAIADLVQDTYMAEDIQAIIGSEKGPTP